MCCAKLIILWKFGYVTLVVVDWVLPPPPCSLFSLIAVTLPPVHHMARSPNITMKVCLLHHTILLHTALSSFPCIFLWELLLQPLFRSVVLGSADLALDYRPFPPYYIARGNMNQMFVVTSLYSDSSPTISVIWLLQVGGIARLLFFGLCYNSAGPVLHKVIWSKLSTVFCC